MNFHVYRPYIYIFLYICSTLAIAENPTQAIDEVFIDEQEFENLSPASPHLPVTPQPQSPAQPIEDVTPQASTINQKQLDVLVVTLENNFKQLDVILEQIALVINNNQIRKLSTKDVILDEIIKIRSLVGMIIQNIASINTPDKATQLIEIAQKLTSHVQYLLTTNLVNFKPFDFEKAFAPTTRVSLPTTYGFEQLEKMALQNTLTLGTLKAHSENVGLNSFHIFYRKLEKLNQEYKILHKLTIAAGVGLALLWFDFLCDRAFSVKLQEWWNKLFNIQPEPSHTVLNPSLLTTSPPQNSSTITQLITSNQVTPAVTNNKPTVASVKPSSPSETSNMPTDVTDFQKGVDFGKGVVQGKWLAQQELREKMLQQQQTATSKSMWGNWILSLKNFLGNRVPDTRAGIEAIPPEQRGMVTYTQNFFERHLKLFTFAFTPIALFDLFKPTLKEWGTGSYNWLMAKVEHVTAFLRGGPVRRQMDIWAEKEITITFDDVIGNEHAKKILMRIVDYIIDYENRDRQGIIPETGILLVGPPRTGKTYLAQALAGTIKKGLIESGNFETMRYLELTTAELKQHGISNILLGAKTFAPIIIFIDEIDSGGFQRERDAAALGELQVAMSTLNRDKSKKVIILAATNKPENLDYSLLEPGRFGKQIDFTKPTFTERKEYLTRELSKRSALIDEQYIDKLAHQSEDSTYDALHEVIVTALQKAKSRGSVLTWNDLDEAFDEDVNKIILDDHMLPPAEQYTIAAHQAGHAYMRILSNARLQLTKVTIKPTSAKVNEQAVIAKYFDNNNKKKDQKETKTIEYGKVFTAHDTGALKFENAQDLRHELLISLAGHVAEKLLFDATGYSYHSHDNEDALNIAKHIVFEGIPDKEMPKSIREEYLMKAYDLVKEYQQKAIELLTQHKEELIVITNMLYEQKTLLATDIIEILQLLKEEDGHPQDDTADEQDSSEEVDEEVVDETPSFTEADNALIPDVEFA